jgi:hypothetical protein
MTHKFITLYARDSKGKILQWNIEVQNNNNSIDIKKSYGEYNGSQAIRWERDIKGVNLGKANETNAWEQAINKCTSYTKRKIKTGYITLEEAKDIYIEEESKPSLRILASVKDIDPLSADLNKYIPKNRTDKDGDIKPMKCQQYYRSAKDTYIDEDGKKKKRNYWTAPDGTVYSDRKYYYMNNPYIEKESGAIIQKFPCIGQPKINGIRGVVKNEDKVTIKSKEGTVYNVPQIIDFLNLNSDIFSYGVNDQDFLQLILDGELYIHGELLQDIRSAVVKHNLNTSRVKLILFDLAIEELDNLDRWKIIKKHIKPKLDQHLNCPIEIIQSVIINNDEEAQAYTDKCIKLGFEGAIFRNKTNIYAFGGRPMSITKLKRKIDKEFKITNIVPQEKDSSMGNYTCITPEGLYFDVTPRGTDDFKRFLLNNKQTVIGKNLTIAFYEYTKDKKPFHILNNLIRDYE